MEFQPKLGYKQKREKLNFLRWMFSKFVNEEELGR